MTKASMAEVETMVTVLANGGPVRLDDLGAMLADRSYAAGGLHGYGSRRIAPLLSAGAAAKVGLGLYDLTEKGRIACALVIARDPVLQAIFFDED